MMHVPEPSLTLPPPWEACWVDLTMLHVALVRLEAGATAFRRERLDAQRDLLRAYA